MASYRDDWDTEPDGEERELCEADSKIGTGTGVCLTPLSKQGDCPRADRHLTH